jgi:hypothetical protein
MLTIMTDVTLAPQVRFEAAKTAALYIHPKSPGKASRRSAGARNRDQRIIVDPVRVDDDVPDGDESAYG